MRWVLTVGAVVARHPRLWSAALGQVRRLAPRGWWRRAPFLPVPAPAYLAFRSQTMYGDSARLPAPGDVVTYLAWCHEFPHTGQPAPGDPADCVDQIRGLTTRMARSLVLNATFEPLCVVPARRALVLVIGDKAETIETTGHVVRSERHEFLEPSVVRLRRFVRVPYPRRRALNRRAVFLRDDHTCQYCGSAAESIDHVVPRSRGGEHIWENVVAACKACNSAKRDRLLHETSMRLAAPPMPPTFLARFVLVDRRVPDGWVPWLQRSGDGVACSA